MMNGWDRERQGVFEVSEKGYVRQSCPSSSPLEICP